jgi:hypothetical protein
VSLSLSVSLCGPGIGHSTDGLMTTELSEYIVRRAGLAMTDAQVLSLSSCACVSVSPCLCVSASVSVSLAGCLSLSLSRARYIQF